MGELGYDLPLVRLSDIEWDTDGEEVELPTSMVVSIDENDIDIYDCQESDIHELANDVASDEMGYCINSSYCHTTLEDIQKYCRKPM